MIAFIQKNIKTIIELLIAVILLIILLTMCGRNRDKNTDDLYKQLLAAKDSINRMYERERGYNFGQIESLQNENAEIRQKDSIITAQYQSGQKIYKLLNDKLEIIKSTLGRVANNNDSLRAIAENLE